MLKSFYTINDFNNDADTVTARLTINKEHAILQGHFPGQPVVPGVVMMQIVRELVEKAVGKKMRIQEADQLKFLAVIDPRVNNEIDAAISISRKESTWSISASLSGNSTTYFKMKGLFFSVS